MEPTETRKLRESIDLLGIRAHATAVGMIQIAIELRRAGVLDEAAMERIKDAMLGDIMLSKPPSADAVEYEASLRRRLDALFAGRESFGSKPPAFLRPGG
ncbi:hypothetical protein [Rhizorhabdus dicambivorans]|uniref:Uncharacterized protein n=1 Tax=Rhizorhabdus dicambivorans TaxID=1850238 RepID=A0A2A4G102_9SPHN|nr:hypothetical protein [Rhizorhabdus dicambivorans]ATE63245.1 hypothetical protein CMV14_01560 [Rhizorhabdus dicambivorans]PCE43457.1 hypothetical protein COO09_03880 [Rhizorhabdus dicambivorans]